MCLWIEVKLEINSTPTYMEWAESINIQTRPSINIQTRPKVVFLELFLQRNFVLYYPDVGMWNILVAKLYMPYYEEAEYGS